MGHSKFTSVLLIVGLSSCTDYKPAVKALDEVATHIDEKQKTESCMMIGKVVGEYANQRSDGLMKLPTFGDEDGSKLKAIRSKHDAEIKASCEKMRLGVVKCRMDGVGNLSGHGQSAIDFCKRVLDIKGKWEK